MSPLHGEVAGSIPALSTKYLVIGISELLRKILPVIISLLMLASAYGQVGGPVHPSGAQVNCDLPATRHLKNKGGSDGAGLCVFASLDMSSDWHNEPAVRGILDWMTKYKGGGYPTKVAEMIRKISSERGLPEPKYIQLEGADIEVIARAVNHGHMACVTYGISPTRRYNGQKIAHMVCCVAARAGPDKLWAILDNNYPGTIEWMTEEQFKKSYTITGGGWAVIFLREGPPPPPKSK